MNWNIDTYLPKSTINGFLVAAVGLGFGTAGTVQAQCGYTLTGVVTQPNCGMSDGIIQLLIAEGVDVYMIHWSSGDEGALLVDQAPGYYTVSVIDWNGCTTTAEFTLACEGEDEDEGEEGGGEDEPIDENCTLKTFTQGGWGSPPNGNNPGMYLHGNFAAAFPNGLTIGCDRTLRLTSAQAVTNYLPGGGPPSILPSGVLTNPGKYKNVLAAQLVAATLNVGMDAYDAGFAPSGNLLGNSIINSGPFAGHTVQQLLDMANSFIGNCGGSYSASQYNEALSAINENYVDGNTDNGFLSCGGGGKSLSSAPVPMIQGVFPNPASTMVTVRTVVQRGVVVKAEILDLTGRVAAPNSIIAGDNGMVDHTLDVSSLGAGVYFIRLSSAGSETTTRLVIAR